MKDRINDKVIGDIGMDQMEFTFMNLLYDNSLKSDNTNLEKITNERKEYPGIENLYTQLRNKFGENFRMDSKKIIIGNNIFVIRYAGDSTTGYGFSKVPEEIADFYLIAIKSDKEAIIISKEDYKSIREKKQQTDAWSLGKDEWTKQVPLSGDGINDLNSKIVEALNHIEGEAIGV